MSVQMHPTSVYYEGRDDLISITQARHLLVRYISPRSPDNAIVSKQKVHYLDPWSS